MIVGSLLLILAAVAMLVLGLASGSNGLLIGSIAASLLAAIVLIVGARRAAVSRAAAARVPGPAGDIGLDDTLAGQTDVPIVRTGESRKYGARGAKAGDAMPGERAAAPGDAAADVTGAASDDAPTQVFIPTQSRSGTGPGTERDGLDDDEYGDEDPPDEPAPETVAPQDAARVARMSTEVLVIDGRPRYHHPTCVHLLGRENEPLPVSEAVELGFTPCGLCEPDAAMLMDSGRV